MENIQYTTWVELFKIYTKSDRVLHHIMKPESGEETMPKTNAKIELWSTLDAKILQWIYTTISTDVLHTIVEPDTTAIAA